MIMKPTVYLQKKKKRNDELTSVKMMATFQRSVIYTTKKQKSTLTIKNTSYKRVKIQQQTKCNGKTTLSIKNLPTEHS